MIARYGDRWAFMEKFNPDSQSDICRGDCFFGDYPTLGKLNRVYGKMTAAMWLVPQLYNLSEFCGCKGKLEGQSLEECARIIADEFCYLKVSEVMLFFQHFKAGRYGRFYGSVDPLVITTSLRTFMEERSEAHEKREQAKIEAAREKAKKNAMPWDEYQKKSH